MQETIAMKIGSLALTAAAMFLTLGTPAGACNMPRPGFGPLIVPDVASIVAAQGNGAPFSAAMAEAEPARETLQPETASNNSTTGAIAGLWQITFKSGGQVVDVGFDAWHSDGTEMLNDTPAPATGNVCLGVWSQSGRSNYRLKHPSWTFDNSGNLTGTAVIREAVTLNVAKNQFSGTYTIEFFDTSGNSEGRFDGTVEATRITP